MTLGSILKRVVTGKAAAEAAKQAVPGAAANLGYGLLTGGPTEGLIYGAGDFLGNFLALRGAQKILPKKLQGKHLTYTDEAGKTVEKYDPSFAEGAVNLGASLGTNALISNAMMPREPSIQPDAQQFLAQQAQQVVPQVESQIGQNAQQLAQRSYVNELPQRQLNLSPNTMYQMQGIEHTAFHYPGVTLPPELLAQLKEQGIM